MITSKQVLIIAIATFVTVVAWVVFDILHNQASVRPAPNVEQLLEPISPEFDQDTLNQL